jgi:hypothetical protein
MSRPASRRDGEVDRREAAEPVGFGLRVLEDGEGELDAFEFIEPSVGFRARPAGEQVLSISSRPAASWYCRIEAGAWSFWLWPHSACSRLTAQVLRGRSPPSTLAGSPVKNQ